MLEGVGDTGVEEAGEHGVGGGECVQSGYVALDPGGDRSRGADRVLSLARDFPDQWYDLNNPTDPAARSVTIPLRDLDFPAGVTDLATAAVAVRLAGPGPVPATVVSLHRGSAGGATTTGGIASTRRGNAAGWVPILGSAPTGDWQLRFGAGAAALFGSGGLDDVLLVIGWTGQGPKWAS